MNVRLIPRLEIKWPNLVKGVQLEGVRPIGKPADFARAYGLEGADELLYMDVVASLYRRDQMLDLVEQTARELFIPLTVGGGLRSLDDIRTVLRSGADKVAINTAAIETPQLIRDAALAFGSSTIVVSIEAKRRGDHYEAYVDSGRQPTGRDPFDWAERAVDLGAGEIMITSVDHEGSGRGFDLDLTRELASRVPVPVIACGGCGRPEHLVNMFLETGAGAGCVSSVLHYEYRRRGAGAGPVGGGPQLFRSCPSGITATSLGALKAALGAAGISARRGNVAA